MLNPPTSPGQANYAAANCCMKALINQRRSHGLAASSVDVSRVVGVGYVDRQLKVEGRLTKEQKDRLVTGSMSLPMSESDLHQAFTEAIVAGRPGSHMNPEIITGIAPISRKTANMNLWPGNPKFGLLVRDEGEAIIETGTQTAQVPVRKLLEEARTMDEVGTVVKSMFHASRLDVCFVSSNTRHRCINRKAEISPVLLVLRHPARNHTSDRHRRRLSRRSRDSRMVSQGAHSRHPGNENTWWHLDRAIDGRDSVEHARSLNEDSPYLVGIGSSNGECSAGSVGGRIRDNHYCHRDSRICIELV